MNEERIKHLVMELSELQGVGWHTIHRLNDVGYLEKDFWNYDELLQLGITSKLGHRLVEFKNSYSFASYEKRLEHQSKHNYSCISYWDKQYPEILKEIAQPPWLLYAKGRLELLEREAIAIVGTRYPTSYGKSCTKQLSSDYSKFGLCVVSGLANGVDTIAHRNAMNEVGSTIAVLPTAITHCYPANNFELYETLSNEGLLLSETALPVPVHPGQFHQRNRIIAGLCRASIIIEGERKSGSMITARHSIEMDREVFAVPGPINSSKSEGPNFLIQNGYARMLMSSQQLFEELSWLKNVVNSHNVNVEKPTNHLREREALSADERKIVELLHENPLTINEIFAITAIEFGQLNILLLNLCIKQFIELQPGSIYIAL